MELKAYNLSFIGDTEKERQCDFCVHGNVSFIIDGVNLSDDSEWCVSASAFHFLRSVFENHLIGVEEFMIPHCGHFLVPSPDKKTVDIVGCPWGIDFNIIHEGNLVRIRTKDNAEYSVPIDEYANAVAAYADQIADFYRSNPPRRIDDEFDREGFSIFVSEWNSLYNKVKDLNNDDESTDR